MAERYNIDLEIGDYSEWETDNSDAQMVVGSPGLDGSSFKSELTYDTGITLENVENDLSLLSSLADIFRLGCRVMLDGLAFSGTVTRFIFLQLDQLGFTAIVDGGSGTYDVEASGLVTLTTNVAIDDLTEFTIEVRHQKESGSGVGDGQLQIYVNGILEAEDTAVTNFSQFNSTKTGLLKHFCQNIFGSANPGGSVYVDDIIFRDDDTPIFPAPSANYYLVGIAPSAESGDYLYATIWRDDELFLQQRNSSDLAVVNEVSLGACTEAELLARTYIAWPYAVGEDDRCFVHGRMNDPDGLGGVHHICLTTDGAQGLVSVESGFGSNYCPAIHATFDPDEEIYPVFYALENVVSGNSADFHVVAYDPGAGIFSSEQPYLTSIPFLVNAGCLDVLRPGRAYGEKLLVAGFAPGDSDEMVAESVNRGASWADITDSFPGDAGSATRAFYI
jgi:hypothetical protein